MIPRLVLALVLAIVAACSVPAAPPPPISAARPLTIGLVGEPASLLGDDPVGLPVAAAIVEPLVRRSDTEDLEPRLAVGVPTFANGDLSVVEDASAPLGRLVAVFRIRDGARWHDGAPVTADDVRFAFEQDRAGASGADARDVAERIDRVEAVDERTVRVSYRAGERWELYALAPRALPRHLLEGAGAAALAQYAARPVHAGPYRVVDRSASTIVLDAFTDHVLGAPRLPRIVVRSYSSRTTLISALLAGEIDLAPSPGLEADLAPTLDRSFGDRVSYKQSQAIAMLRFGPRFADPVVRRAVALAIDRDRIANGVFGGRARVPSSYLVPPQWAASAAAAEVRADPAEARAVLEGAGARYGTFGIAELRGDRLVGTILVPHGSTALEQVARRIAVDLAALGLALEVLELPLAEVSGRISRGHFDLAVVSERADDPALATEHYRGGVSAWYDVLSDAARAAPERADKRALYAETQRLWSDALAALPLYQVLKVDVVPVRMDHVRPASHASPITWNVGDWRAPAR